MANKFNSTAYSQDYFADVKNTFSNHKNVFLIKGQLPEIIEKSHFLTKRISYLQIDLNNSYAETQTLKFLYDKVSKGGVIVLDDFAYSTEFQEARISMEVLAKEMNFQIITLPTGQGLILK